MGTGMIKQRTFNLDDSAMKLYGTMKCVVSKIHDLGGVAVDEDIAAKTHLDLEGVRNWFFILHNEDFITLQFNNQELTAKITALGRAVLRNS